LNRSELPPGAGQLPRAGFALYLRQGDIASGPYPRGLLERYLELGRVRPGDQLSQDGVHWHPVASMLPVAPALDSPAAAEADHWDVERRRARLRWIEERDGGERRKQEGEPIDSPARSGKDRRSATLRPISQRPASHGAAPTPWKRWNSAFVVLGVVAGVVLVTLLLTTVAPGFVIQLPSPVR
jgi:hypothetical protein